MLEYPDMDDDGEFQELPDPALDSFNPSLQNNMNNDNKFRRLQTQSFFQRHSPSARKKIMDRASLNLYLMEKGLTSEEAVFNRHMFMSQDGNYIYHVSIIDYMQLWNLNKKSEQFTKKWFLGKDGKGISAVEPGFYSRRFLRFVRNNVFKSSGIPGPNQPNRNRSDSLDAAQAQDMAYIDSQSKI